MSTPTEIRVALVGIMLNTPDPTEWHLNELDEMRASWPDEYAIAVSEWRERKFKN